MVEPFDPGALAALANMQGTMTSPNGVLTMSQALNQRAMEAAQQRTAQATQEASKAGQAYQQTAASPAPTPDALSSMLPLLMGNIASVIAQDPNFARRGQQNVAQQRSDLAQTRADNLMALKDNYDKKAILAAHLGDQQTEMDARQRSEQLSKTLEVLLQNQHEQAAKDNLATENTNQLGQIAARGAQQRQTDAANNAGTTGAANNAALDQLVTTTRSGNPFMDLTNVNTPKAKDIARQYAATQTVNGKPVAVASKDEATQLRTMEEVQRGLDQVENTLGSILPHQTGNTVRDFLTREATGAKNAVQAAAQSSSPQASFGSTYPLAIRSLQAVAAGPGSGFRLNQSEINLIQQRWPKLNDNIETAKAKLQWERWFLQNKEQTFFSHDWRAPAEPEVPGMKTTNILSSPATPTTQLTPPRADGNVKVVRKSDGRTGWMSPNDPDLKSGLFTRQ